MINKIAAIVVLFHPPEEVFCNISTYSRIIKDIIIIDNSGKKADKNLAYVNKFRKNEKDRNIYYYDMKCNKGLAEAFNYGLDIASKIGCDWCFTMDSDSSFKNDIASIYINAEKKYGSTEIIAYAPQYDYDRIKVKINNNIKKVTWTMTSGTMFNVKKLIEAGGFDTWYFVDGIDVELGYRLKKLGYKILRCNSAILNHLPAQTVCRNLFGKTFKYGIASPERYYYQARADTRIIMSYFSPYAFLDLFMRLSKIIFLFDRKKEYLTAWKKGVKDAIYNRGGQEKLLKIKYKLLKYKKVSFDIYDTLVKRDVGKPEDVFYLLAKEYISKLGERRTKEEIINIRLEAQKKAEKSKNTEETSIYEIYLNSGFDNNERQFLMNKELELEYKLSCRNPFVGQIYDWCIQCKKEILVTSDMYLPQELIERILEKNNYKELKKLYLSSSIGKRKSTGNLFNEIYNKENCRASEIIHIGDAKKGDYLRPLLKRSKAVLIKRNMNLCLDKEKIINIGKTVGYTGIEKNIRSGMLHSFINNRTDINEDIMLRLGYELLGPIVYSYCRWLHKQKEEKNISHIYFLAREGVILKSAYLNVYPEDKDICSVLRVSRHALKEPLEEPGSLQRKYLEKYLSQEGLNISGNIAVADVGWQGTMQYNLTKILPDIIIYGFYIGFKKNENLDKVYGFLFEKDINKKIQDGIMFTATFFENCFMVPEGSTLQYKQQGNNIIPVLDIYEQPDSILEITRNIQQGITQFIEDAASSGILCWIEENPDISAKSYLYFMAHINKNILKDLDNMVSRDDNVDICITARHGLVFYILHPIEFIKEFKANRSKLLFMRSIMACPFPYRVMLSFLKRIEEKY